MSDSHQKIVESLKTKIKILIGLFERERLKNKELEAKYEKLLEMSKEEKGKYNDLLKKYNTLKTAKSIVGIEEDVQGAKVEINRIVRGIDKCIALLNS